MANEFGFRNETEFNKSLYTIIAKGIELKNKYRNFEKLDVKVRNAAYTLVVAQLDKSSTNPSAAEGGIICEECPFNNCDECWGGPGSGCTMCVQTPGDGGGGGPTSAQCRAACLNKKNSSIASAEFELMAELTLGCGIAAADVAVLASCFGPLGTAAGGVCTYFACGSVFYARYLSNVRTAENEYVVCLYGCN